jgi:predicted Zn-ribbon and HTH transcriptional regulator
MGADREQVYSFLRQQQAPIGVQAIKQALHIEEPNLIERAILRGLNQGFVELSAQGFRLVADQA